MLLPLRQALCWPLISGLRLSPFARDPHFPASSPTTDNGPPTSAFPFVIRHWATRPPPAFSPTTDNGPPTSAFPFVIRHSAFVIRHSSFGDAAAPLRLRASPRDRISSCIWRRSRQTGTRLHASSASIPSKNTRKLRERFRAGSMYRAIASARVTFARVPVRWWINSAALGNLSGSGRVQDLKDGWRRAWG